MALNFNEKCFSRINLVPPRICIKFFQISAYSCFYDVYFPNLQGVIKCFYMLMFFLNNRILNSRFMAWITKRIYLNQFYHHTNFLQSQLYQSMCSLKMISRSPHIFIGWLFTSCALLLRFSFFRAISDMIAVFSSDITDWPKVMTDLDIWQADLLLLHHVILGDQGQIIKWLIWHSHT